MMQREEKGGEREKVWRNKTGIVVSLGVIQVTSYHAWRPWWWLRCYVTKSCNPSSPPGSSVCGILQMRTLEWVAISFSRCLMTMVCWILSSSSGNSITLNTYSVLFVYSIAWHTRNILTGLTWKQIHMCTHTHSHTHSHIHQFFLT